MKLSVGIKIEGYTEQNITDTELLDSKSNDVLVYLDRESNDRLMDYYKGIRSVLRQGSNKLVLLFRQGEETEVTKAITHLCLEYGCYNIYKIVDEGSVTKEYADNLFKREASQDEVQMFVSAEDEAYETIADALIKITELTLDNKLDELQDYIMQNKDLIKNYPSVISYMKQNIDEINFGIGLKVNELEKEIERVKEDKKEVEEARNALQTNVLNLETVIRQREEESEKFSHRIASYDATLEKLKKEKSDLEEQVKMLESSAKSASGGSMAFIDYTPMKLTEQRGNKIRIVLYIKEVTRPKYINTFMTQLFSYMNEKHTITSGKVKMVIYDDRSDFGILYNPLIQVNTNTYFEQKANVLNAPIVVFTDTNPTYIRDIATHSKAEYLIVYDRLGKTKDILYGEAIIKFYTFSSKKELINYKQKFADLDESRVIMNPSGVLNTLEISELEGFSGNSSPAAKFAKYFKMPANKKSAASLFTTIVTKCGLPAR